MKLLLWPFIVITFLFFYAYEILEANLKIAWHVLTPSMVFEDVLIAFKAPMDNSLQIVLLMNLVTMTPGTISVDYQEKEQKLLVHLMFKNEISGFERKLTKIYIPFVKAVLP